MVEDKNLDLTGQAQTPPAEETKTTETVKNPEAVLAKNRELLAKQKQIKDELAELQEFKKQQELKEQEAKGNYQAVIDSLRGELEEAKKGKAEIEKNYAFNSFSEQIKSFAKDEGCANPDKLMRLMTKEQMQSVEVDSNFNVNRDDLTRLMNELKEEHKDIGLFRSKTVNINNVNGSFKATEPKSVSELSKSEIMERLRQL